MKKNIVILCDFDIAKRPRPFRLAKMLQDKYTIFGIAKECSEISGIKCFAFPPSKTAKDRTKQEEEAIINYCKNNDFKPLIYTHNRQMIVEIFNSLPLLDLVIVEDITLLPFATDYVSKNPKTKILIDLREYYPLEYENNSLWMESFGRFFQYLCEKYLSKTHYAITVSQGIAKKYEEVFGLTCEVVYSLPPFESISPTKVFDPIKIIYHGFVSPDRNSQNLIEIAKLLGDRFCLYIMALSNHKNFLENLKQDCIHSHQIKFLSPVDMNNIIHYCNDFDIGLITLYPNSFNNAHAMPNKFFEYIQSRLCVVSTPILEIKGLIDKYHIGKTSKDFCPQSIAETLNQLDLEKIFDYKLNAHKCAQTLSTQSNYPKIIKIIESIFDT